jgi:large subunit ribosomal protein L2
MGKRLISQRRGRIGGPYQSPSHRHKAGKGGIKYIPITYSKGKVKELQHDPGRSAPIARVRYHSG